MISSYESYFLFYLFEPRRVVQTFLSPGPNERLAVVEEQKPSDAGRGQETHL